MREKKKAKRIYWYRIKTGSFAMFTPALFGANKTKKVPGVNFLGWCEYKLANSGAEQTAGLRPRW